MDLNVSDENRNLTTPDGDIETKIDEKIYMGMSLTPEIVQAGYQSDYATTVTAKNLLMAKRISEYQETFSYLLSNHVKLYLNCDSSLQDKIESLILKHMDSIKKRYQDVLDDEDVEDEEKEKFKLLLSNDKIIVAYIIKNIIKKFTISLPVIDMVEAPALKNAFDDYKSTLENYIDSILPDSVISAGMGEEVAGKASVIRDIVKSTLLRKFMSDNNYIPELSDMITTDSDGKPKINILSEFNSLMKPMSEALIGYLKDEDGVRKLIQEAYKNAGIEDTGDSYGSDSGSDNDNYGDDNSGDNSGGDSTSGEGGDDFSDGGNFNFGDDNSGSGDVDSNDEEKDQPLNTEDDEEDEEVDNKDTEVQEKPKKEDFDNKIAEEKEKGEVIKEEDDEDKDSKKSDEKPDDNKFKKNHTLS
jgi:hypothetical protein